MGMDGRSFVDGGRIDPCFRVIGDSFLKKVGLAFKRDHIHEVEWIGGTVVFRITERYEQTVSHKFDVLAHEPRIDPYQSDWKSVLKHSVSICILTRTRRAN